MEFVFIAGVAWVIFAYIFAEVAPIFFELLGYALEWILMVVCEAVKFVFICITRLLGWVLRLIWRLLGLAAVFIWRGLRRAAVFIWRGLRLAALFGWLLLCEWWRGPAEEDEDADAQEGAAGDEDSEDDQPEIDPLVAARDLFGLAPGFSKADLTRAFRETIKMAHSDLGGDDERARQVIAARDAIMRARGWA